MNEIRKEQLAEQVLAMIKADFTRPSDSDVADVLRRARDRALAMCPACLEPAQQI